MKKTILTLVTVILVSATSLFAQESTASGDTVKTSSGKSGPQSKSYLAIDLGLNTFVDGNQMPDLKPMGSRYVSLNWHHTTQVGSNSPLFIVSGLEFAFNNYMFDKNYVIEDVNDVTQFSRAENLNIQKSKLTHSSVNLPLMFMLRTDKDGCDNGFRIGAGGFVGYRLGAHSKLKYNQDSQREKDKTRSNYNLSDFQYGVTGVVGYKGLDLFAKYNMNELFKDDRGPEANVISFGLRLNLE
ncbi:outer membrane beta-barrel protein [Pontibacter harenae]|uniref:outer membrane beta-barrel protein n=1 Tax=Pontibacter harenae TaxID=2894083 RepID=UPI001E50D44B|nr:outer membrane beta-barrel protein [Pontibacter harenae]MCC9167051.1 PorT family protein [Pontibacter harenae]